jgi:predicted transcriptional regulator
MINSVMMGPETPTADDDPSDTAGSGHTSFDESRSVSEATVDPSHPDVVAYHTQLTGYCRDMLRTILALNRSETVATGVNIEARMEAEYGYEISDVYGRLEYLVENDQITKQYIDGRTKRYQITQYGQQSLRALAIVTLADLEPLLTDSSLNLELLLQD